MTTSTDAVPPNDKESMLDLARDFANAYDDGAIEFDEDSLARFVDVLRVEIARELYVAPTSKVQADHIADEPVEQFLSEVRAELIRARRKFPGDRIMTIALAEEFGELCKAVLDESAANVRKEAVQTAVMCARVVLDGDGSVISWRAERGLDALVSPASSTGNQEVGRG